LRAGIEVDSSSAAVEELGHAWGRENFTRPRWLVDVADLPADLERLEAILRAMPPEKVVVRGSAGEPGGAMERFAGIPEGVPLERFLRDECVHVMACDVQTVSPEYGRGLERFLARVRPILDRPERRLQSAMIGFFLSSPGSVAQLHADREHNFLLHVAGEKEVHVFPRDGGVFPDEARERLFCDGIASLPYEAGFEEQAWKVDAVPGVTCYQPALCPHWVRVGPEISFSVGLSLYCREEDDMRVFYRWNRSLRRLGARPRPFGERPATDRWKSRVGRSLERVVALPRRVLGKVR